MGAAWIFFFFFFQFGDVRVLQVFVGGGGASCLRKTLITRTTNSLPENLTLYKRSLQRFIDNSHTAARLKGSLRFLVRPGCSLSLPRVTPSWFGVAFAILSYDNSQPVVLIFLKSCQQREETALTNTSG